MEDDIAVDVVEDDEDVVEDDIAEEEIVEEDVTEA